jgi:hypothetical protein
MLAGYAVAKAESVAATWRRQRRLTRETRREEAAKTRQAWWWHGMGGYRAGDTPASQLPPIPEDLFRREDSGE